MGRCFMAYKRQFDAVAGHDRRGGSALNLRLGASHTSGTMASARWHSSLPPFAASPKAWRRRELRPLIANHQPTLSGYDYPLPPNGLCREGSRTRPKRSRLSLASRTFVSGRIASFLIVTL